MKTYFKDLIKNLMMPARQVFGGFAKTGGEVSKAPEAVPAAPNAAPTKQDAQKARESAAKREAELKAKIQKVESDPEIKSEAKKNIIEQTQREMEAVRQAPVLSDEQHAKNVSAINRILMPPPGDPSIPPAGLPDVPPATPNRVPAAPNNAQPTPNRAPAAPAAQSEAQRNAAIEQRAKEIAAGPRPTNVWVSNPPKPGEMEAYRRDIQAQRDNNWASLPADKKAAAREAARKQIDEAYSIRNPAPGAPTYQTEWR